jgi:hypothetical protein
MMCAVISSPLLGGVAIKITAHTPAKSKQFQRIQIVSSFDGGFVFPDVLFVD